MRLQHAVRTIISLTALQAVLMAQQAAFQPVSGASVIANKAITKTKLEGSKMPMPLVAPLFIQDETTNSEITMVSDLSKPLAVDVVLWAPTGEQLAEEKVVMAAYSQKKVKISDLLARARSYATHGSVVLVADRPASLAAQLSIVNDSRPSAIDVEEEFAMPMDSRPANYRAVTSGLSTMPVLSLRSLGRAEQKVSVRCLLEGGGTQTINMPISPNQTILMQTCGAQTDKPITSLLDVVDGTSNSKAKVVAVAVSSSAPSQELAVFGIGLHRKGSGNTLSAIPFWDTNTLNSSNAVYPGVALAQNRIPGAESFKLRAAFANFSNSPQNVTMLLSGGSGAESSQKILRKLKLEANSVAVENLSDASHGAFGPNSIVVQTSGNPGDVLSDIQAVSDYETAPVAVTLPWKDQNQMENGGEHPWTVSRSTSSTVLLFNPDPALENSSVQFTIHVGSSAWTKQLSLPPLSTIAISLNDIIQKHQPDDNGRKLPDDSSQGIITWSTLASPRIFGKLVQLDNSTGVSRPYACGSYTSICNAILNDPDPVAVLPGQQAYVSIGLIQGCTGDSPCSCNDSCGSGYSGGIATWTSSNSSVAGVVSGTSSWAYYQGYSAGQAWANAEVVDNNGCSASGSALMTVQDINSAIQQSGLGNVITSVTNNGDGSYSLGMSQNDYNDLYAGYQFQLTQAAEQYLDCGCSEVGQVLDAAQLPVIIRITTLLLLQKLGVVYRNPLGSTGAPNSVGVHNTPNGKVVRVYGSDGRAVRDIDYGDQAHTTNPEVHDWNWSGQKPVRGAARPPQPGDIPPGY